MKLSAQQQQVLDRIRKGQCLTWHYGDQRYVFQTRAGYEPVQTSTVDALLNKGVIEMMNGELKEKKC